MMPALRQLYLASLLATLTACGGSTSPASHVRPQWFNDVRPQGVTAASARVLRGTSFTVTVRFENPAPNVADLELLGGNCFIRLLIYRRANGQGELLWNQVTSEPNCLDLLQPVVIEPHGSVQFDHVVAVPPVVRARLTGFPVYALAIVQPIAGTKLAIDAGEVVD